MLTIFMVIVSNPTLCAKNNGNVIKDDDGYSFEHLFRVSFAASSFLYHRILFSSFFSWFSVVDT